MHTLLTWSARVRFYLAGVYRISVSVSGTIKLDELNKRDANVDARCETAQRPRQVGVCMKHLPHDEDAVFNSTNVPWQRVINSKGAVSPR